MIQFFRPPLWAKLTNFDSYERNGSKKFKNFQLFSLNLAQISVHKPQKFWKNFSSLDLTFAKNQFFRPLFWRSAPDIPTKRKIECPPGGQTSTDLKFPYYYFTFFITVIVKFQIEIRFFIELHGNSNLSMTSCPPSSDRSLRFPTKNKLAWSTSGV